MARETVNDVRRITEMCGLRFATWSPGDGFTRYRFFRGNDPSDYFGPSNGIGTCLGVKESMIWLRGYHAAQLVAERDQ